MKKIALLFLLLFCFFLFYNIYLPKDRNSKTKIVKIKTGLSAREIALILKDEGIIRSAYIFQLLTILKNKERSIKAGDYKLSSSYNMPKILSLLSSGRSINNCFTIPPGYNIYQIGEALEKRGLVDKRRFIELTTKRDFILSLGYSLNTLEGLLFPDTYCVSNGSKEEEIIKVIIERFNKVFKEEDIKIAKKLNLSLYEILILASIIEKETSVNEEKFIISSVFHNRLKKNMTLDSCPTVIYALGQDFDGDLKKEDLRINSPYNTYRYKGLPPSPISNPSMESIKSALYPAKTDYLYFVSMNNGRHKFSKTLEEHNRAVRIYQPKILSD